MTNEAIQAAEILKNAFPNAAPEIAIVLGSGLGELADSLNQVRSVPYNELPGFHKPDVEGHGGKLILGELEGKQVLCLQGRAHLYEGISSQVIRTMVRTCYLMGCNTWIATNAAGSLRPEVGTGRLVVIKDHINFQFSNALAGLNDSRFGSRFVSLEDAYDFSLREKLFAIAEELEIPLVDGIYLSTLGPTFETPAEIHAYRMLGADLVGMSTVSEVMVARHCGMKVLAVSVVTNLAAGLHSVTVTHDETLKGAKAGSNAMIQLIRRFIKTVEVQPTCKEQNIF